MYYELEKLIKGEWWTNVDLFDGDAGQLPRKGFAVIMISRLRLTAAGRS